jgi:hypothetical protein
MAKPFHRLISLSFFSLVSFVTLAQSQQKHFRFQKSASINFDTISVDYMPSLLIREMPRHGADKIVHYSYPESSSDQLKTQSAQSATLSDMAVGHSYFANPWSVSTPNDNDVAVSDSGFVVSVINTNIHIRNISTGTVYL